MPIVDDAIAKEDAEHMSSDTDEEINISSK